VTVYGLGFASFALSAGVRIGASAASATFWTSWSSVVARCGAGLSAGGAVTVSANLLGGSMTVAVSYDAVKVSAVSLLQVAVLARHLLIFSGTRLACLARAPRVASASRLR